MFESHRFTHSIALANQIQVGRTGSIDPDRVFDGIKKAAALRVGSKCRASIRVAYLLCACHRFLAQPFSPGSLR